MKYAWIARHKKYWPVSLACDVLGVITSGFFENMRRVVSAWTNNGFGAR